MPHHDTIALSGTITHVFAHRLPWRRKERPIWPISVRSGRKPSPLAPGLPVTLSGERRPSEIKVHANRGAGREPVLIEHKKPNHGLGHKHGDGPANPRVVLAAALKAGWETRGEPRRKPKHFEVLARQGQGEWPNSTSISRARSTSGSRQTPRSGHSPPDRRSGAVGSTVRIAGAGSAQAMSQTAPCTTPRSVRARRRAAGALFRWERRVDQRDGVVASVEVGAVFADVLFAR